MYIVLYMYSYNNISAVLLCRRRSRFLPCQTRNTPSGMHGRDKRTWRARVVFPRSFSSEKVSRGSRKFCCGKNKRFTSLHHYAPIRCDSSDVETLKQSLVLAKTADVLITAGSIL